MPTQVRLHWDIASLADAISGVSRRRGLRGTVADEFRAAAWLMLVERWPALSRSFRGASTERTYVGAILDHYCVDWIRSETGKKNMASLETGPLMSSIERRCVAQFVDPLLVREDRRVRSIQLQQLRNALVLLSDVERFILSEYFEHNQPMSAIALAAGCSYEAAHKRLQRALMKLRVNIGQKPDH